MQGAGGIGGLVEVSQYGSSTTNCFVAYDGNGNVASLENATDQTVIGTYDYSPSSDLLRASGPIAKANPFRFSTKYQDDDTELVYYGYRYCNSVQGRWLSRDSIGESAGVNVYTFVRNDVLNYTDSLGLSPGVAVGGPDPIPVDPTPIRVLPPYEPPQPPIVIDFPTAPEPALPEPALLSRFCCVVAIVMIPTSTGPEFGPPNPYPQPYTPNPGPGTDPVVAPLTVGPTSLRSPGCPCRPCPPPIAWEAKGNDHGSTTGTHWHWIEWNQDANCLCWSKRGSGPTQPNLGPGMITLPGIY